MNLLFPDGLGVVRLLGLKSAYPAHPILSNVCVCLLFVLQAPLFLCGVGWALKGDHRLAPRLAMEGTWRGGGSMYEVMALLDRLQMFAG